jgi:colanic acid biosynthesis protein WcaH
MEVHDEHIPEETFGVCLDCLPQVCVELVVTHEEGVLLARRINEPVAGEWFWPGGRLYRRSRPSASGLDPEGEGRKLG